MALAFYNTLTKKIEAFSSIKKNEVKMYNCGPTVYDFAHIGNLRAYIFADTLRRTLETLGYSVTQVMNITDIGHLTSDADDGEDKMVKALKRENKPMTLTAMREVADFYKEKFIDDLHRLRILLPHELENASDHISEDIELLAALEKKGYTYKTTDGIYFETSKMPTYGALGGTNAQEDVLESRIGENSEKHSSRDFALWKFSSDETLGFPSPWGVGIPGWHIECSAMARMYLGQPFDIHTGGIDHIPVHHNNEIAQSECAYGVPLANVWMHCNHLKIENERIAKSTGNSIYLSDLVNKFRAESYRLWLLMAHYRSPINFTWEAIAATDTALSSLYDLYLTLPQTDAEADAGYKEKFTAAIENDLDTPKAIALLFGLTKDEVISPEQKRATMLYMDKVFGLGFSKLQKVELPDHVKLLSLEREKARGDKDFAKSDELRAEIEKAGFTLRDTDSGTIILPTHISPTSE